MLTRAEAVDELSSLGWQIGTRTLCPFCVVGWVLRRCPGGYHVAMKHRSRVLALITGRRGSWCVQMFDEGGTLADRLPQLRTSRKEAARAAWIEASRRGFA